MTVYKSIFLDTAPVIYYLQNDERYFDRIKPFFRSLHISRAKFFVSDITIEEYLVYPYRINADELVGDFFDFLKFGKMTVLHINSDIACEAAKIRAKYKGFKAMDAFQLAMAKSENIELFLTNDKQLLQFKEMNCKIVDEL